MSIDPGQAGKEQAQSYVKMLAGFTISTVKETGDKVTRAEPFAAQWQAGNVAVVAGPWTEALLGQYESFPESKFKDMVDAFIEGGGTYFDTAFVYHNGKSETALREGVLQGVDKEIDGYIREYREKYPHLLVFLTGGGTFFLDNRAKNHIFADGLLVIKGLNRILMLNQ